MRKLPHHVYRQATRHDKIVLYFRRERHGKRIRLHAPYDTPEFWSEYNAALTGVAPEPIKPPTKSGSLNWLWDRYRETTAWSRLSGETRRQLENIMKHVLAKMGTEPYASITRADIVATRDAKRETPSAARKYLDAMRGMFEWALEAQHVKIDPTAGVKAPAPKKGGGFKIWTEDEVTAYETRWPEGTKERVWLHVLMYTGLRRGDAVVIGKQHVSNGVATLRTEKGQGEVTVHLPILPILQHTLDIGPIGDLSFVCGTRGTPLTKETFGNMFKKACRAAGVDANGKAAHGLRKVAATRAADNGATVHQLMAIFGWRTEKEALVYTKAADRKRLAAQAMNKLANAE
jgi:integrase